MTFIADIGKTKFLLSSYDGAIVESMLMSWSAAVFAKGRMSICLIT